MKANQILRSLVIFSILATNLGCDQISKNIVRQRIEDNEKIGLIANFLTLTKTENTGAFLSWGNSWPQPVKSLLLTILPLVALGFVLTYVLTKSSLSKLAVLGICCVVGGGFGNIYVYGSVTDFLHINFRIFQTGVFNMADVSIMMGMFMILIETGLKRTKLDETINR